MAVPRYWRKLATRYNLIGARCGNCGNHEFPPRNMCGKCRRHSIGKMVPHRFSGKGKLTSYTEVHSAQAGYENQVPYIVGIVELEEGPRLTSQIVDCTADQVYEGLPVRDTFRKMGEDSESGIIYYGSKFKPDLVAVGEDEDEAQKAG